ncbi:hypothetical protein HY045_00140, partial [Candidatus Woesebacteria bacterium]|nr:hypothetical protein [Candidatus Woesebacteria bacterium]
NDRRDNWTDGYTKNAVVITWVGNNDNSAMSGAVSGVSGASPIWNKVMKAVLDKAEKGFYDPDVKGHSWSSQPDGVIGKNICTPTGTLPTSEDPANPGCSTRFEYFLKDSLPGSDISFRQDVQIDKTTGQLAGKDTPPENIETQNHPILKDPVGTLFCLDCPVASTSAIIRYPSR